MELPDESIMHLARQLVSSGTSPSGYAARSELRWRMQRALEQLKGSEREVLILRYLEQLSTKEIAAITQTTEAAIKKRQLRALERLLRC